MDARHEVLRRSESFKVLLCPRLYLFFGLLALTIGVTPMSTGNWTVMLTLRLVIRELSIVTSEG